MVPIQVPAMFTVVEADVGAGELPPQADTNTIAARMNTARGIGALLRLTLNCGETSIGSPLSSLVNGE